MPPRKPLGRDLVDRYNRELAEANAVDPENVITWSTDEAATLELIRRHGDSITALEKEIATHGYVQVSESGRLTVNPAVAELRLTAGALAPLLTRLEADPDPVTEQTTGDRSAAARGLARARWTKAAG